MSEPGPPKSATDRRLWRLLSGLTEAAAGDFAGYDAFVRRSAEYLAGTGLGEGALVLLVDLPDRPDPVYGYVHADPARVDSFVGVMDRLGTAGMQAWVNVLRDADGIGPQRLDDDRDWPDLLEPLRARARGIGIVDTALAPLQFPDGSVCGLVCLSRDPGQQPYTDGERLLCEAAAYTVGRNLEVAVVRASERAAQRHLVSAWDSGPVAMVVLDADHRYLRMNDAATEVLGRHEESLIGRTWPAISDPRDYAEDLADLLAVAQGEAVPPRFRQIWPGDGTSRWIQRSISAVHDDEGRLQLYHLQATDVTDLYLAEARAAKFAALVESSPDFIGVADLNGRSEFINAAGRRLVGLPGDLDVDGLRVDQFYADGRRPAPIGADPAENDWSGVAQLRNWRGGEPIVTSARIFTINDPHTHEAMAMATIQRDITERIQAQQQIERLAEQRRMLMADLVGAEQAERQRIAQEVHDDAMQLLAAAQLRLTLLLGRLKEADQRATADAVADVLSRAQRSLREVLFDLEPPVMEGRDIASSVEHIAGVFFAGTDTTVAITGTLDGLTPDVASVIYRTCREALSNIRKHADASNVEIRFGEDADVWRVEVGDDGNGIPTPLPVTPGHLGVRGMRGRVEALGGTCEFLPREPRGTVVVITVPRGS